MTLRTDHRPDGDVFPGRDDLALVHDYVTQRGGAERIVLLMAEALGGPPLFTSLYEPTTTYPEFSALEVHPFAVNRVSGLRTRHRLTMSMLAPLFSSLQVDADVVLCSSSGWAHGVHTRGRKIVYCHTPARWLYQTERYLGGGNSPELWATGLVRRQWGLKLALRMTRPFLEGWDQRAAASAHRYLANGRETASLLRALYGIEAEVLTPPPTLRAGGPESSVPGVEPGFCLCVSRLLPYKNVGVLVEAMQYLPGANLVVAGDGPTRRFLEGSAGPNIRFLGAVDDPEMRWLYRNCIGLVAASYEDYGLTPLEAATFGRPSAVLGYGGHLETVQEGITGVFFENLAPNVVAAGIKQMVRMDVDQSVLRAHAERHDPEVFKNRIRQIVHEEAELV
jgi:glycosyltransferase involved in cell wall biosynthesis